MTVAIELQMPRKSRKMPQIHQKGRGRKKAMVRGKVQ